MSRAARAGGSSRRSRPRTTSSLPRTTVPGRALDASMSLLRDLADTSVDPEYARVSAAGRPRRRPAVLFVTVLLAGALFGIAAIQNARSAPALEQERAQLIKSVRAAQGENTQLQQQLLAEQETVRKLQQQALGGDPTTQAELERLSLLSGATPVKGPGIVVQVDDAPSLDESSAHVVDQDLRQLVNGLWTSGAEAISINGHRISSRTAIRNAGSAITVDYVSLTPPYKVEAIGDPQTMPARLQESPGGEWWNFLKQNYGMRYQISTSDTLTLKADPGLTVRHAKPAR